jgi:hypothetical protein
MSTRFRSIAVALLMSSVLGLPAAQADAAATAERAQPLDTLCFLLPVEPGALHSEQWCTKALRGTPLEAILANAPQPFASSNPHTNVNLGVDYENSNLGGASFTWWGSTGCTSSISYVGNYPSDWVDRVSSAYVVSGSGCNWFYHFNDNNQAGGSYYCGLSAHKCDQDQLYIYGYDNVANSMRITA